jgi:hypothetical protein
VWEKAVLSLCSWHAEHALRKYFPEHNQLPFQSKHPPLNYQDRDRIRGWDADFLDTQWISDLNAAAEEALRARVLAKNPALAGDDVEKRTALAEKIHEESKKKEICVSDEGNRGTIIETFKYHLHWHPITHFHLIPSPDMTYLKKAWEYEVTEMHQKCKELGEQWAWEYLWKNWLSLSSRRTNG